MMCYWQAYEPTLESMMLDTNAKCLSAKETGEILSYLPDITGKKILELGAGIGRFTGSLANKADKVTAVDFMPDFLKKNKETNGNRSNVEFIQSDVTCLELEEKSFDIIFTNWLLMYLNDEEVISLIRKMLSWLSNDGFLFVRESCFHPSGEGVNRPQHNPTIYRDPAFYSHILQKVIHGRHLQAITDADANNFRFHLIRATSVKTYIKLKNNPNQLCYLLRKVPLKITATTNDANGMQITSNSYQNLQQFLDQHQYSRRGILIYESLFGKNFVSTGGLLTTEEFCKYLDLKPEDYVLDVGCGIGGSAFHMAKEYGARVHGIDLSSNMISIALERQIKEITTNKVSFEICDVTEQDYPANSIDVIYSRDAILHIRDKQTLFSNFLKWLKPGGRVLITDYCRGDQKHSEKFQQYVASREYHLLTVSDYGKLLEKVGLKEVCARDCTLQFVDILKTELHKFEQNEKSFLQDFSEEDYRYIVDGWKGKLERCADGDQTWGLFIANKKN